MMRFVSRASGATYRRGIKPLLFRRSPDEVHASLIRLSVLVQKTRVVLPLVRVAWKSRANPSLRQTLDGITFDNPVGLSAGFDKNVELVPTIHAVGFGFMTGGSVTLHECAGNPRPWFYRLPKQKSLVVHAGLANQGVSRIHERLRRYKPAQFSHFPLVVSVAKTNNPENCDDQEAILDYVGSLKRLRDEPHVSAFEINISCPNTYGGEPFTTPKRLETLLAAIDKLNLQKPVWIKMPINLAWEDFDALLKVILKHRLTTVTIGNLSKDRSVVPEVDLPANVPGNLSGLPTQKLSDDLIAKTYQSYGDKLTIIGVGGIFSAEDAYRKICLGASLVELITGMIYEGPQLIGQINSDLLRLLQNDGFSAISEAIGSKQLRAIKK